MLRWSNFVIFPFLACLAISTSSSLIAHDAVDEKERERELSSWTIAYSSGWNSSDEDRLITREAVNSVTMRRNDENYDVFFHYSPCYMCATMELKTSYFTVDEEKAQQIKALIDESQIKAALERPCILRSASSRLNTVTVKLGPPPAGYAPFSYDILLACQSAELDEVRKNLDAATRLFSAWMKEHEDQSEQ